MVNKNVVEFQAEINELMNIIINNFYSNKDIFLRELISNASDALDKNRFLYLNEDKNNDDEYKIKISMDKEKNILTISDNGIGMSEEDLIQNLGTIARSGTKHFFDSMKENKQNIDLIGQFGMGFYSAFLVADKVVVSTKKDNFDEYVWESEAKSSFTIYKNENSENIRGTNIDLYIKDDMHEYLDEKKLKEIVIKHSQFINYPIELYVEKTREEEIEEEPEATPEQESKPEEDSKPEADSNPEEDSKPEADSNPEEDSKPEADSNPEEDVEPEPEENSKPEEDSKPEEESKTDVESEKNNDSRIEEVNEEEDDSVEPEPKKKTKKVVYYEWEKINKEEPLWIKNKDDVSEDEYKSLYKSISNDYDDYAGLKHFSIEGSINVKGILFIPKNKPFDMFQGAQTQNKKSNIKLYVKRVLISDEIKDIIPEWLSFIHGVIDCDDLPLNVSREMLQQSSVMKVIKKNIIKKCIDAIEELSKDNEKFNLFYKNFSKNVKLGIHEDEKNRNKLIKLLRYNSFKNKEKNYFF